MSVEVLFRYFPEQPPLCGYTGIYSGVIDRRISLARSVDPLYVEVLPDLMMTPLFAKSVSLNAQSHVLASYAEP